MTYQISTKGTQELRKPISQTQLDYLWVESLSGEVIRRKTSKVPLIVSEDFWSPKKSDKKIGNFSYKNAHWLEKRDVNSGVGTWTISCLRSQRVFGNLFRNDHPDEEFLDFGDPKIYPVAKALRLLCYWRVPTAHEAIKLLDSGRGVQFSCEINSDWYDPPQGLLPPLESNPNFIESHAFALFNFDANTQRFLFPNSWGPNWGDRGWGYFPIENWDQSVVSAWEGNTVGFEIPKTCDGLICRGWKLPTSTGNGIHCIEIFDATNDEYIAWSFCSVRGGYLDVDEFFVSPRFRGQGYARILANLILRLEAFVKRPLRLVVSFADTEDYSLSGAEAVASLFGVQLYESNERWAAKFGYREPPQPAPEPRNWKPNRPASILEDLRSTKEEPDKSPKQYAVFFGTDRKPVDENDYERGFTNSRAHEIHRGYCLVNIPKTQKFGSHGSWWASWFKQTKQKELKLQLLTGLAPDEFIGFSRQLFDKFKSDTPSNLLYIHGYRNSFEDAALRAAQLGCDLKIPGCTFFYSWPSAANAKGYAADEATCETSIEYCYQYVLEILSNFPDAPLHILAHSMGNRVALGLFERLALNEKCPGVLGQLIFAAADVDKDRFLQATSKFVNTPTRMTAYLSSADWAVQLSEWLHGYPRVGLAPPITIADGVDSVLVHGFNMFDFDGHGYFANQSEVLGDIFNPPLIRFNSSPANRYRLEQEVDTASCRSYWSLRLRGN